MPIEHFEFEDLAKKLEEGKDLSTLERKVAAFAIRKFSEGKFIDEQLRKIRDDEETDIDETFS